MHEVTEAQRDDLPKVIQLVNGRDEAETQTSPKFLAPRIHV